MRYQLLHDNDGHTYVGPVGAEDAFYAWVESEEEEKMPEGVFRVDGRLTFTDPQNT